MTRWSELARPIAIGVIAYAAVYAWAAGIDLRFHAWRETEAVRYEQDINNAFRQGSRTLQVGFLDRYDDELLRMNSARRSFMGLDYAPGRLAIATLWSAWVHDKVDTPAEKARGIPSWEFLDRATQLHRSEELVRPLMWANIVGESLSMIAVFWLVMRYTTEPGRVGPVLSAAKTGATRPGSVAVAALAAAVFWFNPALIWNAHCWPQWDSWLLPFFLWAVVAGSHRWHFAGGMLIAAGAMFKGQTLFGAPVLILWPLFQGRLLGVLRWLIGFAFGIALYTAAWMVRTPGSLLTTTTTAAPPSRFSRFSEPASLPFIPGAISGYAMLWLAGLAVAFALTVLICRTKWPLKFLLPTAVVVPSLALWPFWSIAPDYLTIALVIVAITVVVLTFGRWRAIPYAAAVWAAGGLFACLPAFNGGSLWMDFGIEKGTTARTDLAGHQVNNLPAVLSSAWRWTLYGEVYTIPAGPWADAIGERLHKIDKNYPWTHGRPTVVPLKALLILTWGLAVILSAIGLAIQDRRRSRWFLAAVVGPWVAFFAVMPQMQQRYLLWGSALSALTLSLGWGWVALGLFLSLVAWSQEATSMYDRVGEPLEILRKLADPASPGIGWAVLLAGSIYICTGLKRRERLVGELNGSSAS